MIIKQAKIFFIRSARPYAYQGKPDTCKWCGYKLPKLWFHADYKRVGTKMVKATAKLIALMKIGQPVTEVERPCWERNPEAPNRGRGFPLDFNVRKGETSYEPMGNNQFCYMQCAIMYALLVANLGAIPEPISPKSNPRKIKKLFDSMPSEFPPRSPSLVTTLLSDDPF